MLRVRFTSFVPARSLLTAGARVPAAPPAAARSDRTAPAHGRRRTGTHRDETRARVVLYPRLTSGTVTVAVPVRCRDTFRPFDLDLGDPS